VLWSAIATTWAKPPRQALTVTPVGFQLWLSGKSAATAAYSDASSHGSIDGTDVAVDVAVLVAVLVSVVDSVDGEGCVGGVVAGTTVPVESSRTTRKVTSTTAAAATDQPAIHQARRAGALAPYNAS
jgi:hypothetical protein